VEQHSESTFVLFVECLMIETKVSFTAQSVEYAASVVKRTFTTATYVVSAFRNP